MSELSLGLPPADGTGEPSTSGRRVVISRHEIPIDLLVARHQPHKVPKGAVCSAKELRQVKKDAAWAMSREHMLAAGAAAFHLALFAWNLAFWGFEGMPPDRYWPDNPRFKNGIVPGRYGNMQGAKKLWYSYLQKIEGAPPK
eukprot:GHUV01006871.1.p1 GENE.GHUV01006871.1~~GHUV01006871.1.p1  ORF type:complete len:142 (+),score=6.78 GHUV01006871.1:492-917(+)